MTLDARDAYLETEILQADGRQLVHFLYEKALESLREARGYLAQGRITERSRSITRASEIVNELALALDHDTGGEVSRNLVEIYDYIQTLLQAANFEQIEPPLVEAEQLLETLCDAWQQSQPPEHAPVPVEQPVERMPVDCLG